MAISESNDSIYELIGKLDTIIGLLSAVASALGHGVLAPAPTAALAVAPACKYSFLEWLEKWFTVYKAPSLKDGGYDMRHTIEKHVRPNITDKPLNEFKSVEIQEVLNGIESRRMGQIVYSIFNQCFSAAVDEGLIATNPVVKTKRPKHTIEQGRSLTITEHRKFLRVASGNPLFHLFEFYLLTGCRRSEALSIKWIDVTNTHIKIMGTKTKKAVRTLPLHEQLKKLLKVMPKNGEYIFPYNADKVQYEFEKIRKSLKIKDFTIHDLRHTFATRCLEGGVALITVQKWLGHADFTTTANIYSHVTTEFELEEMAKFSQKAGEILDKKTPKKQGKKGAKNLPRRVAKLGV